MGIGWFNVTGNNMLLTTVVHARHYDTQANPLASSAAFPPSARLSCSWPRQREHGPRAPVLAAEPPLKSHAEGSVHGEYVKLIQIQYLCVYSV